MFSFQITDSHDIGVERRPDMSGVGAGLGVGSASPGNYSDRIQGLNFDSLGFDIFGTSNTQLGGTFG